tara:strand:+ start:382 stop:534 length:153 start_codon:yes stop_codon:yes gene_type:complete
MKHISNREITYTVYDEKTGTYTKYSIPANVVDSLRELDIYLKGVEEGING